MAGIKALVIDASVALKWFVDEIDTPKALELRDAIQKEVIPLVPSLFFYEVGNVLRYKSEFGVEGVKNVLKALKGFQFKIEPLENELADLTFELANKYGITVYDASYVAISSIHNSRIV